MNLQVSISSHRDVTCDGADTTFRNGIATCGKSTGIIQGREIVVKADCPDPCTDYESDPFDFVATDEKHGIMDFLAEIDCSGGAS